MNTSGQREIVVEIERVHLTRRRAKVHRRICLDCKKETDFISLAEAARLFTTDANGIFQFITANSCHFQTTVDDVVHICLVAFLEAMKAKTIIPRIRFLGESNK
jgi:hypothetical protein